MHSVDFNQNRTKNELCRQPNASSFRGRFYYLRKLWFYRRAVVSNLGLIRGGEKAKNADLLKKLVSVLIQNL